MTKVGRNYILISSILFFLGSVLIFLNAGLGRHQGIIDVCLLMSLFILLNQLISNQWIRKDKNWIQIDTLFLLMFFGVHFWAWGMDSLGWAKVGIFRRIEMINHVDYSVALALMAMAAFTLGFNIFAGRSGTFNNSLMHRKKWIFAGNLVFYFGVSCTLLYVFVYGQEAFSGRYVGSAVGNLGVRALYLFQQIMVKLGIAMILISHADKNRMIPPCIIPVAIYGLVLVMYLVLGDRSEFMYTGAVGLFAYAISYKRVKLHWILLAMFAVAILSSAVQVARTMDERSVTSIVEVLQSNDENVSAGKGLENISGSGFVLLAATTVVPEDFKYFGGSLKYKEVLGIVPFGRFFFYHPDPSILYDNSSSFFTWYLLGPNASWGVGSTIVADIYIDFGPAGVAIALLILGALAGYMRRKTYNGNSYILATAFCYFAGLLTLLPRYSYLDIIRGLLWPLLILWVLKKVLVRR